MTEYVYQGRGMEILVKDDEKRLVFGFASVVTKAGNPVIDHQNEVIRVGELEKAAYQFVLKARIAGERHIRKGVGDLVESMMFTKEKQDLLNIVIKDKDGDQIEGWWIGFFVSDDGVWDKIKKGEYPAFSIGGIGEKIEIK